MDPGFLTLVNNKERGVGMLFQFFILPNSPISSVWLQVEMCRTVARERNDNVSLLRIDNALDTFVLSRNRKD